MADPGAYGASLGEAREHGTARLHQDLVRLRERSRALSARLKATQDDVGAGARALRAEMDDLRWRNTAALESGAARGLADPVLRAAEALGAAADAWERERAAAGRLGGAVDEAGRRQAAVERSEAARHARDYWAAAEQLLGRRVSDAAPGPDHSRTGAPPSPRPSPSQEGEGAGW